MLKSSKDLKNIPAYQVEYEEDLPDLKGNGIILTHKKSGAKVCLISNEDNNKVFSIGFRTPPSDSTGVPHIVEHTVLCGSKKYPAKDPFNELLKGSLNTFLNAMTYPDKTIYPVASCNDKDFQNLIGVYMDAVLFPNIYNKEEIFLQEGWHYELKSPDAPLELNGIVYSEMKGAFSQPEQQLMREITNTLFPDTTYGVVSGGDPLVIPSLTYEAFLDFHRRYYHPVNSYIYIYGNCDMEQKLAWIDEEYLSKFDRIELDSEIKVQKAIGEKECELFYSLNDDEDEEGKTYYSYNTVIGRINDVKQTMAVGILDEVLVSAPGAPVKQALLDNGLGQDVFSMTDDQILQPVFSIIAKGAPAGKKEEFIKVIRETLTNIVKEGLNEKSLLAAINKFEFKYREADYGRIPKGLMSGIVSFNGWLYNDADAFTYLCGSKYYEELKKEIKTGYFENIIKTYMIEPEHMSLLMLSPKKGLTTKKDAELAKRLSEYKQGLTTEEIETLVTKTKELKKYQEEPSLKEDIDKIPKLTIDDVGKKAHKLTIQEADIEGIPAVLHNLETNGIAYINCMFDISGLPEELISYAGLYATVFGYVSTKKRSFLELSNEINIHTGGIRSGISVVNRLKTEDYLPIFSVSASVLYSELETGINLLNEIIHESVLDDSKRLYEILAESKSRQQMSLTSGGIAAAERAASYYSKSSYYGELTKGIEYFKFICGLLADFENKKQDIINNLTKVSSLIFTKGNPLVSIIASNDAMDATADSLKPLINGLLDGGTNNFIDAKKTGTAATWKSCGYDFVLNQKNEGYYYAGQVQYVARTGNFMKAGYEATGALKVLRSILSREYLWNNVRVLGGAYGCFLGLGGIDGSSYVVSYRDPNLNETDQVYLNMADYVEKFEADEDEMTKYIIGTISDVDIPYTPKMEGSRSLNAFLCSVSFDDIQKERDEILSTDINAVKPLAKIIRAFISQDNICVIGNETKIKENKDMFKEIKPLFD